MKKALKTNFYEFLGVCLVTSPILAGLFLAQDLVRRVDARGTPECSIQAPRELPRCVPDDIDSDPSLSIKQSSNGYYLACEQHGKPAPTKQAAKKYVVAALEVQQ